MNDGHISDADAAAATEGLVNAFARDLPQRPAFLWLETFRKGMNRADSEAHCDPFLYVILRRSSVLLGRAEDVKEPSRVGHCVIVWCVGRPLDVSGQPTKCRKRERRFLTSVPASVLGLLLPLLPSLVRVLLGTTGARSTATDLARTAAIGSTSRRRTASSPCPEVGEGRLQRRKQIRTRTESACSRQAKSR